MTRQTATPALRVGGVDIPAGQRRTVDLALGQLYNHNPITMPVHVVNGARPGPRLFVCAAVHGDELNGIEIVRRLLAQPVLRRLRGSLLAVPMVNVLGVLHRSRYLPDRRDLNRSFPGNDSGSLAARVAHVLMQEVVRGSGYGIDLHTGALHRANLPQVRADLNDDETTRLAHAFGAPVILNAALRDGSLRAAAAQENVCTLLYEAGEALRLDEHCIRTGLRGVLGVMRALRMLPGRQPAEREVHLVAHASTWLRAPASGIVRLLRRLGESVAEGDTLACISDPFGEAEHTIRAPLDGVIIGRSNLPLAHEGDALFHVARYPQGVQGPLEIDPGDDDGAWPEGPEIV